MGDNDRFVEVSHQGYFSRLGSALGGVLVGLVVVVVVAAFGGLFWNEGRAVKQAENLSQGLAAAVEASKEKIDPEKEGRLVHVTGEARPSGQVQDMTFGMVGDYLRLQRKVEMYQWAEQIDEHTTKDFGGSTTTTTTYTYRKEWSAKLHDSKAFKEPKGHENPGVMRYTGMTFNAPAVKVGVFALSAGLIEQLPTEHKVSPDRGALSKASAEALKAGLKLDPLGYYIGSSRGKPEIGDLQVSYTAAMPTGVSVMGRQDAGKIQGYVTPVGGTIELLHVGKHSMAAMIKYEETANERLTWLIRVGGFMGLVIGFVMILRPLSVVMDVIPLLGNVVGTGVLIASVGLSVLVSSVAVALGWVFYRPMIGLPILGVAVVAGVWLVMKGMTGKAARG